MGHFRFETASRMYRIGSLIAPQRRARFHTTLRFTVTTTSALCIATAWRPPVPRYAPWFFRATLVSVELEDVLSFFGSVLSLLPTFLRWTVNVGNESSMLSSDLSVIPFLSPEREGFDGLSGNDDCTVLFPSPFLIERGLLSPVHPLPVTSGWDLWPTSKFCGRDTSWVYCDDVALTSGFHNKHSVGFNLTNNTWSCPWWVKSFTALRTKIVDVINDVPLLVLTLA